MHWPSAHKMHDAANQLLPAHRRTDGQRDGSLFPAIAIGLVCWKKIATGVGCLHWKLGDDGF